MPDEFVERTPEASRELLITCINVARADALKEGSIQEAVDYAIMGTLTAIEVGLESVESPVPMLENLAKELTASWVEEVNS